MERRLRTLALAVVAMLVVAACGGEDATPGASESVTSTTEAPEPEWVRHEGGEDCMCADGSEYAYWSRTDDPEKVVLYFQGGGACFSEELCRFDSGLYDVTVGQDDHPSRFKGIFDFDDPDNPVQGWSMVFVPYCTGDVHLGDKTTEYAPDLTVEHNGQLNARTAFDFMVDEFPDASRVFVTGSSAGGVPAPLYGGLAADAYPDAEISVLADASGGYPSNPAVNAAIGQLWGVGASVPDWPVVEGIAPEAFGIPDVFAYAGQHAPRITLARYDNAYDAVQRVFVDLAGIGEGGLPQLLAANERLIEDAGVDLSVYVAPGDDHTILGRSDLDELSVDGTPFIDWLRTLIDGEAPGDVRCTDCGAPAPEG